MGPYCDPCSAPSPVGRNNCIALCTNATRLLTLSFLLSCELMFKTVL